MFKVESKVMISQAKHIEKEVDKTLHDSGVELTERVRKVKKLEEDAQKLMDSKDSLNEKVSKVKIKLTSQ